MVYLAGSQPLGAAARLPARCQINKPELNLQKATGPVTQENAPHMSTRPSARRLYAGPLLPPTAPVRDRLRDATQLRTGFVPFESQIDVGEALFKNRDVFLIAGTGWGKTLAMVMACFLDPDIVAIIISPLNALEGDQVSMILELFSS